MVPMSLLWTAVAGTFPVAMALGVMLGCRPYFRPVRRPLRAPDGGRHRWKP